jgi:RHS repeat-associated protein
MNGKLEIVEANPADVFYTGKPYEEDLGGYVFNYRTYSPEINRWTTPDPSGFPDGANNRVYAPVPTSGVDVSGLFSLNVTDNRQYDNAVYTHSTGRLFTVTPFAPVGVVSGMSSDYQALLNRHFTGINITYDGGTLPGTVSIASFSAFADASKGGVEMSATYDNSVQLPSGWSYKWIQFVNTNDPMYSDNPNLDGWGFYPGSGLGFSDRPSRGYTELLSGNLSSISWRADAYLVKYNGFEMTIYDGFTWGFDIE